MSRLLNLLLTAVSALVTIAVNVALVRPFVQKVVHPKTRQSALLLSIGIATLISIPTIRHGNHFARLFEKSTAEAS